MKFELHIGYDEVPIVQLRKRDKSDPQLWINLTSIPFKVNGIDYSIRPGFITNLGSVPKLLRHIVDPADESTLAFIIHDYLYSITVSEVTRKDADLVLRNVAIACHQSKFEAYAAWIGVRVGGWANFNKFKVRHINVPESLLLRICEDNNYFPTLNQLNK